MIDPSDWTPRRPPGPVTLAGRLVTVVPCEPDAHGPALWTAFGGGDSLNAMLRFFPNPAYTDTAEFTAWLDASPGRGWQTMVFLDPAGAACGMGSYMRTDAANGVTEMGAVAHGPAMARSPMATEAHYLLARHVFEDLGYRRYEWKLDNRNAPSHQAALRLGFSFEGVFRQHLVVKGENRDTAWYAMIDKDWPRLGQALETWLDPSNFDGNGRQKSRLEDVRERIRGGAT